MARAFRQTVLLSLRAMGGCSCAALAKAMKAERERVYAALYELERQGLVLHPRRSRYTVTAAGRRVADGEIGSPRLFG